MYCIQKERRRKKFRKDCIQQLEGSRYTAQKIGMVDKVIARQTKDWTRFSAGTLTSLTTPLHDRTKRMASKQKGMNGNGKSKEGRERKRKTEKDSSEMLDAPRRIIYHHHDTLHRAPFIQNAFQPKDTSQMLPRTGGL